MLGVLEHVHFDLEVAAQGPKAPSPVPSGDDGVGGPARTSLSCDCTVADVSFTLAGSPNDPANSSGIARVAW